MKKKIISGLLASIMLLTMTSCSSNTDVSDNERKENISAKREAKREANRELKVLKADSFGGEGKRSSRDDVAIRALLQEIIKEKHVDMNDPDVQSFAEYAIIEPGYPNSQLLADIAYKDIELTASQARGIAKIIEGTGYENYLIDRNQVEAKAYIAQAILSEYLTRKATNVNTKRFTQDDIDHANIQYDEKFGYVVIGKNNFEDNSFKFVKVRNNWFVDYTENMDNILEKLKENSQIMIMEKRGLTTANQEEKQEHLTNRTTSAQETTVQRLTNRTTSAQSITTERLMNRTTSAQQPEEQPEIDIEVEY